MIANCIKEVKHSMISCYRMLFYAIIRSILSFEFVYSSMAVLVLRVDSPPLTTTNMIDILSFVSSITVNLSAIFLALLVILYSLKDNSSIYVTDILGWFRLPQLFKIVLSSFACLALSSFCYLLIKFGHSIDDAIILTVIFLFFYSITALVLTTIFCVQRIGLIFRDKADLTLKRCGLK